MGIPRCRRTRAPRTERVPTVRLSEPGIEMVEEVEAFMCGRLADHYVDAGRPAPTWMLLNRVALGRTPYGLRRIQQAALIPVELYLAEGSKTESFSPGQVFGAASAALDVYSC